MVSQSYRFEQSSPSDAQLRDSGSGKGGMSKKGAWSMLSRLGETIVCFKLVEFDRAPICVFHPSRFPNDAV